MSPTSLGANPLATPSIPGPPQVPEYWRNPPPETWKQLDGRTHYLQTTHNLFLEMHPNATRGVHNFTKYCVLNILILNLTDPVSQGIKWSGKHDNSRGDTSRLWNSNTTAVHIIRSNFTGRYLCMNDRSVVYQSDNFSQNHCAFHHQYHHEGFEDRYYKLMNGTVKWYLGMNKEGFMICGNRTTRQQKGVNFTKGEYSRSKNEPPITDAAPVKKRDKKVTCCMKKRCKKDRRRRKCVKSWCKPYRRKFFELSLKQLRKYFKHCVQNKVRHCKKGVNR